VIKNPKKKIHPTIDKVVIEEADEGPHFLEWKWYE
jgi:hypothetical protein